MQHDHDDRTTAFRSTDHQPVPGASSAIASPQRIVVEDLQYLGRGDGMAAEVKHVRIVELDQHGIRRMRHIAVPSAVIREARHR